MRFEELESYTEQIEHRSSDLNPAQTFACTETVFIACQPSIP